MPWSAPTTGSERREDYAGRVEDGRCSAAARGYDGAWKRVRAWFIRLHPLCAHCLTKGRVTPVADVDHIVPIAQGGARLDADNLQSLCRPCHRRKTEQDKGKRALNRAKGGRGQIPKN